MLCRGNRRPFVEPKPGVVRPRAKSLARHRRRARGPVVPRGRWGPLVAPSTCNVFFTSVAKLRSSGRRNFAVRPSMRNSAASHRRRTPGRRARCCAARGRTRARRARSAAARPSGRSSPPSLPPRSRRWRRRLPTRTKRCTRSPIRVLAHALAEDGEQTILTFIPKLQRGRLESWRADHLVDGGGSPRARCFESRPAAGAQTPPKHELRTRKSSLTPLRRGPAPTCCPPR